MLTMRVKSLYFDKKPVLRAAEKAKRDVLSASADAIRDTARESMPPTPGLAAPGHPPHMQSGWLKRSVRAAWDRGTVTALAGPIRAGGAGAGEERLLMRVLEFGGRYALGRRAKRRRGIKSGKIVVTVKAKPYMGPALKSEQPKLPRRWAGVISKG